MKKVMFVLVSMILSTSIVHAGPMSATGPGGSCSACKVEQGLNPFAEEAVVLIVQGGEPSAELKAEMTAVRNEQVAKFGPQAAELSDEALLLIISNK